MKKSKLARSRAAAENAKSYALIAPYMLIFFTFSVLPVLIAIFFSFTRFNMLQAPQFIGFANYMRMFGSDDVFYTALKNTLFMAVIVGPGGYLLSLFFAWMINELSDRLRPFVTFLFYAPSISGNVYLMWTVLFSGDMYGYINGMLLNLDGSEVWVKFLGRFNAYNLTSVYATALLLGARRDEVLRILSDLTSVDGRFEPIHSKEGVTAIVDYAHTPDALQNVIGTINEIRKKDQRLYVVVGCGGNRDATKRPEMAKIAVDGSDMAVLTSDNPRLEEPGAIIEQMKSGLEPGARYLAITDRREAIKAAVALARPGDIILVAGKGHETYQDVGGVKHHFDDREEVRAAFGTVL